MSDKTKVQIVQYSKVNSVQIFNCSEDIRHFLEV